MKPKKKVKKLSEYDAEAGNLFGGNLLWIEIILSLLLVVPLILYWIFT